MKTGIQRSCNLSRRDFIKTTAAISLGSTIVPGIFSCSGAKPIILLEKPDPGIFLDPGQEYRGVPFFFFNDEIDPGEAVRQVREMHKAGWGKVMPRRYEGLMDPAYGEKWNKAVHEIIKVCRELNMKVFLQEADKNAWYSATPTAIPGMKDEYRNKFLIRRKQDEQREEHEELILQHEEFSYYQHTAYPRKGWENSFCYLDLLDKDTVNSYLSALFSFLEKEFGQEFGKTIEAVWVAEPHIMMGNPSSHDTLPWTPRLNEIFESEWGYPLIGNIPKLFEDTGDFQKVRYHYWRTLSDLLLHSYSETMHEWCKKYNLKFTGHLMGEDSYVSQLQYTVNVMPHFEYMDIPGIDHLTMELDWPTGDPFIYTPKLASSVANQMGKKEVLSEMYGCSDTGNSFEDRKRVFQWMALLGINYRNYHGAFYSMRGMRKRKYPVNLNYQQPYWSENRLIADFGARLSYLLRQGTFQADILIIHSLESYYLEGRISRKLSKVIAPIQKNLIELSHNLLKIQCGYEYGDETLLSKYGKIKNGAFVVGKMAYKVVILPSVKTLRKSTLKLLNEFTDAGGTILSTGDLPGMVDGVVRDEATAFSERLGKVSNTPEALQKELGKLVPPAIIVDGTSADTIWVHARMLNKGQLFYLTNTSREETIEVKILIRGKGRLENWNPENGRVETAIQRPAGDYIETSHRFAPGGSLVLVCDETEQQTEILPQPEMNMERIPVNDFTVVRKDPNSMTLDFCRFHKGDGKWSDLLPVLGVHDQLTNEKYSGPVSLKFEFVSEIKPSQCSVVIEEAAGYRVKINNEEVSYSGLPWYRDRCFHPIDITRLIREGRNGIELSLHFEAADKAKIDNNNLRRFYGTELEQIYLTGDFAVRGEKTGNDYFECKRDRYKSSFVMTKESGKTNADLLADGYCFFNGTITLTSEVTFPQIDRSRKYFLEIEDLKTVVAGIRMNGRQAGNIAWKPYRVEITDLVVEGKNKIEILLTNSLRNLLGALHYVPLKDAPGGQWSQKSSPSLGDGAQWYLHREDNKYWSDDYFFRPFGVGRVSVLAVANEG